MSQNPQNRARELFFAAIDIPAEQRDDFLTERCSGDEKLRAEVESLLEQDAQTAEFMDAPVLPPRPADTTVSTVSAHVPEQIGRYHIKSLIGSGGMASVYLAVQEHPRRKVALKVMKSGIASRSALRRFEFESQILGRLRHPNIAQVFEAGTHDTGEGGVPYFAMEYIPSHRPITAYAREKKLSTKQRLELFAKVCDAVHHGHQKGIIHRDLKPGNILVDSSGEPKVIDFGVARSTDSDMAVTTLQTDVGQLIGTLQYMSPEQCEADPDDLDTRSDVYALGVVLYELLCEQVPYDVTKVTMYEAARVVREHQPPRPSTVDRTLRGDVETIALKALEKERDRRYKSAEALGDDIHKYLNSEPIEARPPSVAYQLKKFVRRHRGLVAAVLTVFVILVLGVAGTTWGLVGARQEAERARRAEAAAEQRAAELEQMTAFQSSQLRELNPELMGIRLRQTMREEAQAAMERLGLDEREIDERTKELDPLLARMDFTSLASQSLGDSFFEQTLAAIDRQFAEQPLVRATLLQTMGDTAREIGLLDLATAPHEQALEIRRRELGDDHPDTLASVASMGRLLQALERYVEAEAYFREALEGRRRVLGDDDPATLTSLRDMAYLVANLDRFDEAERYAREALEGRRRVMGEDHLDTLDSLDQMGAILSHSGKLNDAEPYIRDTLRGIRRVFGNDHPRTTDSIRNYGAILIALGRYVEAEPYCLEAVEGYRSVMGNNHPDTLVSIRLTGDLLRSTGRFAEAEPYYQEAVKGQRRVLGDLNSHTLHSILKMGGLLRDLGRLEEADALGAEALRGARSVTPSFNTLQLWALSEHGRTLSALGRFAKAEAELLEAHEGYVRSDRQDSARAYEVVEALVDLYDAWHEAEPDAGHDAKAEHWRAMLPPDETSGGEDRQ